MRRVIEQRENSGWRGFPLDWKISAPKYCPAFRNLSVDEEGRIFVGTYEKMEDKLHYYFFDVFDVEGRYIAKVSVELKDYRYPLLWKNKKLYIIDETEEGFQLIKKYKVTWKYQ